MKYVYLHINESGVFYVGCGSQRRPWNQSKRSALWKQVADSGYSILIVGEFSQQDAWEHEKWLIAHFRPSCNIATGGPSSTGFTHAPESRKKISLSQLGENNSRHKFTKEQVLAILRDTRTQRTIAAEYGITQPRVSYIKTKRQWSHVA